MELAGVPSAFAPMVIIEGATDYKTVTITFPTEPPVALRLDAAQVDDLLSNLGSFRGAMKPEVARKYGGGGEIAPGLRCFKRENRASHVDPPASSYAIMRRLSPDRGVNPGPGEDVGRRA